MMTRRARGSRGWSRLWDRPWLGGLILAIGLAPSADASWPHARHDADATNRAEGSGALRGDPDHAPGFAKIVEVRERALAPGRIWDVDGDGVPEYLTAQHGSAVALDLRAGGLRWRSPPRGIDQLAAIDDFDGDGSPELLATASGVGGGLLVVDLATGALRGEWTELAERSGIDAAELTLYDLDADGHDELVAPAGLFGLAQAWVLDFETGLSTPRVGTLAFEGYANFTPIHVGRFLPGGQPALLLDQGSEQQVFVPCDEGGDGGDEAAGFCPSTVFFGVHPSFAFGRSHVVDLDGDGFDEVLTVASQPNTSRGISVLDVTDGLATGQTAFLLAWAWRHDAAVPTAQLATPAQPPVDLDGDGRVEVLVSIVNDLDQEQDASGAPADDGVNRVDAISTLVLDGATGAVELVLDDVFAYGWADLDGNGRPEVIVSPTAGWTYAEGLLGVELDCAGACGVTRWQVPDARILRYLDELDGTGLPDARLSSLEVGGVPALVVHQGETALGLLRADARGVVGVGETVAVSSSAVVHAASDVGVVVADDDTVQLLDGALVPVAAPVAKPLRGTARWRAAPLRGGEPPVLAFEGRLLDLGGELGGGQTDEIELLPHVAFIADLDGDEGGDGRAEIVHFRNPTDGLGPGFEIRVDRVEAGELAPVWSRSSHADPVLDGYVTAGALHFQYGDFDGQGARDLVVAARRGADWSYLVFDGDSGAVDAILQPGATPSTYSPALIADLYVGDGIDEVLMHGSSLFALLAVGVDGPVQTAVPDFYHSVGLNADLDGDGRRELLGTLSATLDNQIEARRPDGTMDVLWGPRPLGKASGNPNVVAVGQFDGQPGLDPVYVDGVGGVEIFAGADGTTIPGSPVYMDRGALVERPTDEAAVASTVIVADVDGDGVEEAVVGTSDGRIYALNVAVGDPGADLEWAIEVGAAVGQLAAADADDDGQLELLVANERGEGLVIDDLGVVIRIDDVADCVEPGVVQVQGDALGLSQVELWLNGNPVGPPVAVSGERWTIPVELRLPGEYQLEARGLDAGGEVRILATAELVVVAACPDTPGEDGGDDGPGDDQGDGDGEGGECRGACEPELDDGLIDRGCIWCGIPGPSRGPMSLLVFGLLSLSLVRRRRAGPDRRD